jgi:23S rRNA pseudouridine2605 synthase
VKERIQKVLAAAGVDSRRNVELMVRQGRIAVNGKVSIDLPILIDPQTDKVTVDDEPIRLAGAQQIRRFYFLLNKPKGVLATNVAQGAQVRAIDLLPKLPARVYPVGRLDAQTAGLLLLTNDGELTNRLTHPRYGVAKTYRAVVDGEIRPAELEELEKGVWLSDPRTGKGFKTKPGASRIKIIRRVHDRSILEIQIREGRDFPIRRMLTSIGHKVRELTRTKIGPLTLDKLNTGQFRELTGREIKSLRGLSGNRPEPTSGSVD